MGRITTIGLDIAKSVFQVHGVGVGGHDRDAPTPDANAVVGVLQEDRPLPRWDRSLRRITPLGHENFGHSGMMCD